jgi:hypothetical protein
MTVHLQTYHNANNLLPIVEGNSVMNCQKPLGILRIAAVLDFIHVAEF